MKTVSHTAERPRTWHPGIAIWVTGAFHIVAIAALLARPQWWPSILGLVILNHVALGLIGLWPRSRLLGSNMLRLPDAAVKRGEIAVTFDDGPDPDVTPKVLDILDAHRAKASFFVIAERAAAHPALVREIVRRGHSIENHSRRHASCFALFGWSALKQDVGAAQEIIERITGRSPAFFRAPMGLRNPMLDPLMAIMGLRYTAWTRRGFDTVTRDPAVVLRRLTRNLSAGDILLLHDRRCRDDQPIALEVLPPLLEQIEARGLRPVSLPLAMQ
ncbi:MAG TPA: polysaccharide deacetylase family protein [Burkholderiales bacterium]|nr:polysaccharide deacetylase family protein [Burkholderiales bacterium]